MCGRNVICDVRKSKLKCDSEGLFHMSRVAPLFGLISSPRFSVYGSALQVVRGFIHIWLGERAILYDRSSSKQFIT